MSQRSWRHHFGRAATCALLLAGSLSATLAAAEETQVFVPPRPLQVHGTPAKLKPGTTDLKFAELFKMPVGPKGLTPSDKLRQLAGQRVRMVGFVAHAEEATPGLLILTPMPQTLGDEDEKLVDDLPPTAVFVHLSPRYAAQTVPNLVGLVRLEGRLELGAKEEADGHVSATRLLLDDHTSRLLTTVKPQHLASAKR